MNLNTYKHRNKYSTIVFVVILLTMISLLALIIYANFNNLKLLFTYKPPAPEVPVAEKTYNSVMYKVQKLEELSYQYNKEDYQFDGWYLSNLSMTEYQYVDKNATSNLTYYAKTTPLLNLNPIVLPESTYKFETINKNLHSSGTSYVYQPKFPAGPASSVTLYDWYTSNTNVATVSAYSSITAKSSGYCVLTARL